MGKLIDCFDIQRVKLNQTREDIAELWLRLQNLSSGNFFQSIFLAFRDASRNLYRSSSNTLVACLVSALIFLVLLCATVVYSRAQDKLLGINYNKLSLFFVDSVKEEFNPAVLEVGDVITQISPSFEKRFFTSQDNFKLYYDLMKSDASGLEDVLPASLELKLNLSPAMLKTLLKKLKRLPQIEHIESNLALFERVYEFNSNFVKLGLVSSLIFITVAVVICANIIQISINHFRGELKILRSLGGNFWLIHLPFCFEGMIIGILSGVLACSLALLLLDFASNQIPNWQLYLSGMEATLPELGMTLILSSLTGLIAGVIAVLRA